MAQLWTVYNAIRTQASKPWKEILQDLFYKVKHCNLKGLDNVWFQHITLGATQKCQRYIYVTGYQDLRDMMGWTDKAHSNFRKVELFSMMGICHYSLSKST